MTFSPVLPVPVLVLAGMALLAVAVAGIVRGEARGAWALRAVAVVLLVLVGIRPAIPPAHAGPTASGGLEVYFAVDTTSSMAADDVTVDQAGDGLAAGLPPTRLDAAKTDIVQIAHALAGARFSLVTFDAEAVQRVPLTSDVSALESAVDVMTQEVTAYSRGSRLDVAVPEIESILRDARAGAPDDGRMLFYLGDGEQTSGGPAGSFASLAPYLDGGGVLGYGTDRGGRMLAFDGYSENLGELGYILDYTADPPTEAVSRIDEAALERIAAELGVAYLHRDTPGGAEELVAGVEVGPLVTEPGEAGRVTELYWIPAAALALILVLEFVRLAHAVAELRPVRREVRGR